MIIDVEKKLTPISSLPDGSLIHVLPGAVGQVIESSGLIKDISPVLIREKAYFTLKQGLGYCLIGMFGDQIIHPVDYSVEGNFQVVLKCPPINN